MKTRIIDIIKKFPQCDGIDWSSDFSCPECGGSAVGDGSPSKPQLVGWCETNRGPMAVLECPHCYTKFRDHAATVNYMDIDEFEMGLRSWLVGNAVSNSKELLDLQKSRDADK